MVVRAEVDDFETLGAINLAAREKLDTLQYKVLQMEFISTDIHKHSQQLELLKKKDLELKLIMM